MNNLFANTDFEANHESIETLIESRFGRLERIVSNAHASPEGFWYDQDEHEWVVVLQGRAKLLFDDDDEPIELGPGDFVNIRAHKRHRVDWTDPNEPTIWLALHYSD